MNAATALEPELLEKLQAIWERRHPEIWARLMTLDAAAHAAASGNLVARFVDPAEAPTDIPQPE